MVERPARGRLGCLFALSIDVPGPLTPRTPEPTPWQFPRVEQRTETVILEGGDFEPGTLLAAYRAGFFPWPHDGQDFLWFSPARRAVFLPGSFHVSRRLARRLRQHRFRLSVNEAFGAVIRACGERREGTWITPQLRAAFERMHELGWAHSIEVWSLEGALVGGVYGLRIGGCFFAESMFHRQTDASKIALAALMRLCLDAGVRLVDAQLPTPHLLSLGAQVWPRERYLRMLEPLLDLPVEFPPAPSGGR